MYQSAVSNRAYMYFSLILRFANFYFKFTDLADDRSSSDIKAETYTGRLLDYNAVVIFIHVY